MEDRKNKTLSVVVIGGICVILIIIIGTFWTGQNASKDTELAVHSVSLLYLDELAGRREQVVENNLQKRIEDMDMALALMTKDDLSDSRHLRDYQAKMKKIYKLEKFAFVDTTGLIYTSKGNQTNIDDYHFDYLIF